jgi:hypothetical protein
MTVIKGLSQLASFYATSNLLKSVITLWPTGAMEVENGHYMSDLEKTALPRRIPHKDICWSLGENSDRQFLFCSGKFQCFYYSAAMKVWRNYRLLAEMLIENDIFPTIFLM